MALDKTAAHNADRALNRAVFHQLVQRFLACPVNESQANQSEMRSRSLTQATFFRVLWFALLFLFVAGLTLYAAASSFPIPGGSEPRSGSAAVHECIGVVIMQVIHGPFSWLYPLVHDGKTAWALVWLIWAAILYSASALVRRPRWVFTPRDDSNEPGNA